MKTGFNYHILHYLYFFICKIKNITMTLQKIQKHLRFNNNLINKIKKL